MARSPEELETMLEDAFVLHDHDALGRLFEPYAVLHAAREEARGREQIEVLIHQLWGRQVSYLADPRAILHQRGIALIVSDLAVSIARRDGDGNWRYAVVLLRANHQPGARPSKRASRRAHSASWT